MAQFIENPTHKDIVHFSQAVMEFLDEQSDLNTSLYELIDIFLEASNVREGLGYVYLVKRCRTKEPMLAFTTPIIQNLKTAFEMLPFPSEEDLKLADAKIEEIGVLQGSFKVSDLYIDTPGRARRHHTVFVLGE